MQQGITGAMARMPRLQFTAFTVAEIEDRLLTACKTLRALPDPVRRYQVQKGNTWPDVILDVADAYGYTEAFIPRFKPSPAQVSDCLPALELARGLDHKEFRLIWWRSFDLSFRAIGMRLHRSDERARQLYRDCILRVWYAAQTTG